MTDRINGFYVALEKDTRVDDAEATIAAVKQIKGVLSVKVHVSDMTDHFAYERVRRELGTKLWEILYPKDDR